MSSFALHLRMLLLLCVAIIAISGDSFHTKAIEIELLEKARAVKFRKVFPEAEGPFEIPKFDDEKYGEQMLDVLIQSVIYTGVTDHSKSATVKSRYMQLFGVLEDYRVQETKTRIRHPSTLIHHTELKMVDCNEELRKTMSNAGIDPQSRFFTFILEFFLLLIFDDALTQDGRTELFFKCLITIGILDGNDQVKSKPYLDCFASELLAMLNNKHNKRRLDEVTEHIFYLIDTLRAIPT